jgi:hypothetical protein
MNADLKSQIHECCSPGLVMEGVTVIELPNHGKPCFKAVSKIGSLFGSEVEGELTGIGATREQALERLKEERAKLYESMWA